jgi:hypothetical protein
VLILIVAGGREKGRVYEFSDDREIILGREAADVALTDSKVSRRHSRLWCDGGRWYVQDLESRHGTYRNHKPIDDLQPLKDGDYLQIGRTVMVVGRLPAETAHRAGLVGSGSSSMFGSRPRLVVGGLSAAAAILLGLNVATIWSTQSGVDQLEHTFAQSQEETDHDRTLRNEVRLALQQRAGHERRVETMLAAFGPQHNRLMPKLESIQAAIDNQPDVLAPLTALAEAMQDRSRDDAMLTKIDSALAMLEAQGGEAQGLADQFRLALAERPSVEQIAAAVRRDAEATSGVLAQLVEKLQTQQTTTQELAALRKLIEDRPEGADAQLKPLLETVLAKVETLDPESGQQELMAAIAEVRTALPPDPSSKLDAMLARFEAQPTRDDMDRVNLRLTQMAQQLGDRREAKQMQAQLESLIEASEAERLAAARTDPMLAQLLSRVDALAAQDAKLDAIYASLQRQPYQNRAMLDEALAQAAPGTSEADVAAQLDVAMAELRGKSITDADAIRRLIRTEVVAAVGAPARSNGSQLARRDRITSPNLTKTEQAYKLAFEQNRKVMIGGQAVDPRTGDRLAGRVLDPAQARADGLRNWRDWYLTDDFKHRTQLDAVASRIAEDNSTQGFASPVQIPPTVNVNAAAPSDD